MTPDDMIIRPMTRDELDTLVEWAAGEGWNPGLDDAEVFWNTDPEGFIAAEIDGELAGGGSIVAYGTRYGFMGFFIMRQDLRGRGLGDRLWHERKRLLRARLDADAPIGMDGVFTMQSYYARGGFGFVCRDLRFEGEGVAAPWPDGVVEATTVPFEQVAAYDRRHFPAERDRFLHEWIRRPGGHALVATGALGTIGGEGDGPYGPDGPAGSPVRGYAVLRPCRLGHKIGPLFADDAATAESLFAALSSLVPGQPIFLDAPENNPEALALAARHGMTEVFGCARMILGPIPELPDAEIFGVTTFELG